MKREELDYPDLGYAFLPAFWGKGYASEAVDSVLKEVMNEHSLHNMLAVTLSNNQNSKRVLEKAGFTFKEIVVVQGSQNDLYEFSI